MKRSVIIAPLLVLLIVSISSIAICQRSKSAKVVMPSSLQNVVKFNNKSGPRLPFNIVEERSLPSSEYIARLTSKDLNSTGNVSLVIEKANVDNRTLDSGFKTFDSNGNVIQSKTIIDATVNPKVAGSSTDNPIKAIDYISPKGKYVATTMLVEPYTKSNPGKVKKEIYDDSGKLVWEAFFSIGENRYGGARLDILDTRDVIVERGGEVDLLFHDFSGHIFEKVDIFTTGGKKEWVNSFRSCFSNDGQFYVVNASRYANDEVNCQGSVILFTHKGEEVSRFDYEREYLINNISISPDNRFVLASSTESEQVRRENREPRSSTYIIDQSGLLIKKFEDMKAYIVNFSSNSTYVLVYNNYNGTISIIELVTRSIISELKVRGSAFDIAEDDNKVVIGSSQKVIVLGFDGTPFLYETVKTLKDKQEKITNVQFSDDGKEILVSSEHTLVRYRLNQ